MNEHDYPPSPSYYQQNGADCRNHVTPEYWRDSAFVHLFRAGRKSGETFADAIANAFLCLALWFRSQGLPVPYYSAELARLRGELAALRSDGAPLESAPPSPAASDEWTDDELAEWLDAKYGTPKTKADGDIVWPGCGVGKIGNEADATMSRRWFMVDTGATRTATEAARILGATKPADPFAELLTIETDEQLREWLKSNPHRTRTPAVLVRAFDRGSDLAKAGWYVQDLGVAMTARDAARALHRILTGGAE